MAKPNRGLGRGLAGMIEPRASDPETPTTNSAAARPNESHLQLTIDSIVPNRRQPRHSFNPERLQELADSIAQDGLVQPIVVRRSGDGYELIAGERRWRAAKLAGVARIPALVREADDREALLLAIVENVVRADLNPIEVARGYASLIDEMGLGASDVARRVGRSRAAVANTLRLLDLPDDVLDLVTRGDLTEGHGRAILQAADREAQRALASRAAREGLTVRQTEALARRGPTRRRTQIGSALLDGPQADDLADAVFRVLGAPARIRATATGVRIEVDLTGAAEVSTVLARLHITERDAASG